MRARTRAVAAVLGLPLLLSGCGFKGAQSFPLPGGEGTGDDAYDVVLEFPDALDLVEQSAVKVADVTVGSVSAITLRDFTAVVTVSVRPDVVLPANTVGSLRQSSLLGEKFVSLDAPEGEEAVGTLRDGDLIPLARTTRNAEIEEVLSALSLVLNGGSLEQLQVINRELTNALEGREAEVKDLLKQLNAFVGGLDDQKADIVRALDSLDRLTVRLAKQRGVLATALEDIPDGARVLSDNRAQLTKLVQGLSRLGDVSSRVIRASQQNTVADLRALEPILSGLNAAGRSLPRSLELLTTYPFPRTITSGIRGDYANLYVSVDAASLQQEIDTITGGGGGGGGEAPENPVPDILDGLERERPALQEPLKTPERPELEVELPRPGTREVPRTPSGAPTTSEGSLTDLLLGGMR